MYNYNTGNFGYEANMDSLYNNNQRPQQNPIQRGPPPNSAPVPASDSKPGNIKPKY